MALSISMGRWDIFILVLVRVAAMVMVAPVLGARPIPGQVKIGLSLVLALLLTPLQDPSTRLPTNGLAILLALSREVVVGLLLGFAGALVFSAVQMATHLISVQVGFAMPSTMDPFSPESASFLDSFYSLLAMVIFLNLGGHHALIVGLSRSFELMPLGGGGPAPAVGNRLVALSSAAFTTATQLAMPATGTMLLADAAMALVVRAIPQMNVFVVGLPVKIAIGLFTLAALIPVTIVGLGNLTRNVASAVAGMVP